MLNCNYHGSLYISKICFKENLEGNNYDGYDHAHDLDCVRCLVIVEYYISSESLPVV